MTGIKKPSLAGTARADACFKSMRGWRRWSGAEVADEKLKQLYNLIEDGVAEVDDLLKERIATLKADRDRAKEALNRARCGVRKDVLEHAVGNGGELTPGVRTCVPKWRSLLESNRLFQIENLSKEPNQRECIEITSLQRCRTTRSIDCLR
jgi:hypothetical protein